MTDETPSLSPPPARIVTSRLVLRCWEPRDAPLLKAAIDANLDHLQAWMPWAMEEPSELSQVEARLAQFNENFAAGTEWLYGAFDPAETEVIGGTGLHPRGEPGTLEIGYWLRSDMVGRGLATEAAAAATRAGLAMGATALQIRCDPRNVRSAAIPRRLAYHHVGTVDGEGVSPDGSPRATMVWELVSAPSEL